MEYSCLEVVMHAKLQCTEEDGIWEIAHDTGNMLKYLESSVDMVGREFGIGCLGVGIAECCIEVLILPGVLLSQEGHNLQVH
jgi:hypothetical protein